MNIPTTTLPVDRRRWPIRARRPRDRSGFWLLEVLIALSLIATVALIATKTLHSSLRATHRAETVQTQIAQWEQAISTLRRDAWHSRDIAVPTPESAVIRRGDGAVASWNAGDAGVLERVVTHERRRAERMRWTELGRSVRFERSPAGDLIVTGEAEGQPPVRLRMSPAVALMQEGSR
jgi:prepilin-type N-terminal cleavage/methylation domain-containing protein